MDACRITFSSGETVEVRGDLETVLEELHKVATRREHSFAVMQGPDGEPIAMRPGAVIHVRPAGPSDDAPPSSSSQRAPDEPGVAADLRSESEGEKREREPRA